MNQILEDTLNPHVKEYGDLKFNPMLLSNLLAKINYQSEMALKGEGRAEECVKLLGR